MGGHDGGWAVMSELFKTEGTEVTFSINVRIYNKSGVVTVRQSRPETAMFVTRAAESESRLVLDSVGVDR